MTSAVLSRTFTMFATCPSSNKAAGPAEYVREVVNVARWSEAAGCDGILVYTDNGLVDAWLVAQRIIEHTERLCPLVAVQPVYMHPYTVAKMVSSLAYLHGRRVWLNMVAGGFKNDLIALNDHTPHDRRYDRLAEYTTIIRELLKPDNVVTFEGQFYTVKNLKMTPPLPPALYPGITISGSSDAGLAVARRLDAVAVQYPRPVGEYERNIPGATVKTGIRVGVIAREDGTEAWTVARARFPEDRRGQLAHQLAMKVSDSVWHQQLSRLGKEPQGNDNPYWLHPFENYWTFCPYLVGSYERVAAEVARYIKVGYRTFILDVPHSADELQHIRVVFDRAARMVA